MFGFRVSCCCACGFVSVCAVSVQRCGGSDSCVVVRFRGGGSVPLLLFGNFELLWFGFEYYLSCCGSDLSYLSCCGSDLSYLSCCGSDFFVL